MAGDRNWGAGRCRRVGHGASSDSGIDTARIISIG